MESDRENDLTLIGRNNWQETEPLFGIKRRDRRLHSYLMGKSGTGKSTALLTMILQDLKLGEGAAVVDPHGDLAERVLDYVPSWRVNDVVYFNPADLEHPIAFNPLETVPTNHPEFAIQKTLVASGVIAVFKKIWSDSWGPRLEYILRSAVLALLECPGSTLLGVPRLLADPDFRDRILRRVRDPVVLTFWRDEFASYSDRFRAEALAPIQNKVGAFLSSSLIRNIVAQPRSSINFREIMDSGKILILNLSKGRIGEDNASLLGALVITKLQLTAMERARVPEQDRRDFWLYVDEFQTFATEAFGTILSEARKTRLGLVCANQFLGQLPDSLRDAVLGNVGTLIAFRIGAEDAQVLEPEFEPQFHRSDFVKFRNHQAAAKLTVDGVPGLPFSMGTVLPNHPSLHDGHREKIIRVSRERYGRRREQVEDRIQRWFGKTTSDLFAA